MGEKRKRGGEGKQTAEEEEGNILKPFTKNNYCGKEKETEWENIRDQKGNGCTCIRRGGKEGNVETFWTRVLLLLETSLIHDISRSPSGLCQLPA